jgi:uncharacterized protein YdeI (YjbR/CyaY-like superfamily)
VKLTTTLYVKTRTEWRKWLSQHHRSESEIWLIFYKRHTGQPSLPYNDAVEEALCFGWIDSIIQKLDDERYVRKFTPRKPNSKWSEANLKRVQKLVKEGRIAENPTPAIRNPKKANVQDRLVVSADVIKAMRANKAAEKYFNTLPPGYLRLCMRWIDDAKKPETRVRRIEELVELTARGERIGMK